MLCNVCVCVDGLHSNYSPKPGGSNKDWKTDPLVGIPSPTSSVIEFAACFPRSSESASQNVSTKEMSVKLIVSGASEVTCISIVGSLNDMNDPCFASPACAKMCCFGAIH